MAHFGCVYVFGYLDLAFFFIWPRLDFIFCTYILLVCMHVYVWMDGYMYAYMNVWTYALMNAHVCMYACMNAYVWTCARRCMNAIMYVCIGTGFEGVYSASEHWLFEEICPPQDIWYLEEIYQPRDISLIWFCPHAGLVFTFVYLAMDILAFLSLTCFIILGLYSLSDILVIVLRHNHQSLTLF